MYTGSQENKGSVEKQPSFRGIYFIGLAATAIGIAVIIFLNLATPLEYMHGRLPAPDQTNVHKLGRQLRGIAVRCKFDLLCNWQIGANPCSFATIPNPFR